MAFLDSLKEKQKIDNVNSLAAYLMENPAMMDLIGAAKQYDPRGGSVQDSGYGQGLTREDMQRNLAAESLANRYQPDLSPQDGLLRMLTGR